MRRITALLLAGLAALTLTGCRRGPGLLPYACLLYTSPGPRDYA